MGTAARDAELQELMSDGSPPSSMVDEVVDYANHDRLWLLHAGESVYSEAFFLPMIEEQMEQQLMRSKDRRRRPVFIIVSHLISILVNGAIQSLVLWKVKDFSDHRQREAEEKLFETLCDRHKTLDPFQLTPKIGHHLHDGSTYYNCAPITPFFGHNISKLDLDKDGFWTVSEALTLNYELKANIGINSNFINVQALWFYGHKLIKKGRDAAPVDRWAKWLELDKDARVSKTSNLTKLPTAWLEREFKMLSLCVAADKHLCGNLEARKVLRLFFPTFKIATYRLLMCEQILGKCNEAFGQEYQVYVDWTRELCGERERGTFKQPCCLPDDDRCVYEKGEECLILTTQYEAAKKYRKEISQPLYFSFLIVILLIWWMSVAEEVRKVTNWWVVILRYPTQPEQPGLSAVTIAEDKITINAVGTGFKAWTLLVSLLPRTFIAVGLSYVGTLFLLRADSYEDLILNSVALGFLIEVDNMLFTAVASDKVKEQLGMVESMKVSINPTQCLSAFYRSCPCRIRGPLILALVSGSFVVWCYNGPEGKLEARYALNCLCQTGGPKCIAAQYLGGSMIVPDSH